jgi:hypothetical protein
VLTGVQSFSVTYFDAAGLSASSVPDGTIPSLSKIKKIRLQWALAAGETASQEELVVNLRNYR